VEQLSPTGVAWLAHEVEATAGVLLTHRRNPGEAVQPITATTPLTVGCSVLAVGSAESLPAAVALLGRASQDSLPAELAQFEVHRYFVSNRAATERRVADLGIGRLGAALVRLRRGDVDLPVHPDTVLQMGDRVRVVSLREKEPAVRAFFGNSLTVLTETGYFSFALGIILGLVLGQIPVPVPGLSQPIKLGIAGGPLVAALWLGARGRTGPFVWAIPNEVNLALRHLGILLFLAAVGVKAGQSLPEHLRHFGLGMVLWSTAFVVTAQLALLACLAIFRQREQPVILGAMAALQTQPALLSFAATRTDSGPLNTAYATAYPLAVVLKIILAQLVLAV
jgi:putative transport protein